VNAFWTTGHPCQCHMRSVICFTHGQSIIAWDNHGAPRDPSKHQTATTASSQYCPVPESLLEHIAPRILLWEITHSTTERRADPPFSCLSSFAEHSASDDFGVWIYESAEYGGSQYPAICRVTSTTTLTCYDDAILVRQDLLAFVLSKSLMVL
jgi:hypothetical protein